jgi:hypothetical protein
MKISVMRRLFVWGKVKDPHQHYHVSSSHPTMNCTECAVVHHGKVDPATVAWRGGAPVPPQHLRRRHQEKSMVKTARAVTRHVATHPDNGAAQLQGFSKLPTILQLEVISYLYDDLESLSALFAAFQVTLSHIRHHDLKRSIGYSILQDSARHSDSVFCRICNRPTCYPYQLIDASCGHHVCGRCAWDRRQEMGCCGCGVRIRSRPKRVEALLGNKRAFWLLSTKGMITAVSLRFPERVSCLCFSMPRIL